MVNLGAMRYGPLLATDGSESNDAMTKQAIEYMEAQIEDPKLREILRPNAKCLLQNKSSPCMPG